MEFDQAPFGILGLETALPLTLTSLVDEGHLSLATAIERLTLAPAEILGVDAGTLKPGAEADVVLFDPQERREFTHADIGSKSKNSPFLGTEMTGRVKMTLLAGEVTFRHESMSPRVEDNTSSGPSGAPRVRRSGNGDDRLMPAVRSFRPPRIARRFALGVLVAVGFVGAGGGCAYFNTLYNAKAKFAEAQEIKYRADPDRLDISLQERNLYDDAIEKAARVVKFYEDSKWVDDALLLMGRAAFEKGDYSTALRKFDEIMKFYPESNLMAETLLWQGRTRIAVNELTEGEAALSRAAAFDEKKWRDSVIYFTGLAAYEREDFDVALASFTEVVN